MTLFLNLKLNKRQLFSRKLQQSLKSYIIIFIELTVWYFLQEAKLMFTANR